MLNNLIRNLQTSVHIILAIILSSSGVAVLFLGGDVGSTCYGIDYSKISLFLSDVFFRLAGIATIFSGLVHFTGLYKDRKDAK